MNSAERVDRDRKLPYLLLAVGGLALWCGVRRRMRRLDFRGFSVVITGGSRGLGLEIARQFTREGARVTLLARDGDELSRAELAKDRVLVTTVIPGLVAFGTGMAARLLPAPAPASEHARHTGHESTSKLAPSLLTKPSDSMIPVNNEE